MAKRDTLFTVAGITTHTGTAPDGTVSTRTKVRYGTDLARVVKMLSNPKKIEDQTLGICLAPVRVDFVTLPTGMVKDVAIRHLMTLPEFASAEDQLLLQESLETRLPKEPRVRAPKAAKTPKAPRTPKPPKAERVPKAPKSPKAPKTPTIDSLRTRARKAKAEVSVEAVLEAAGVQDTPAA